MTPSLPSPALYVRLPNWVGDVCMSLPSLEALLATGLPVVACARPWARDLLSAYPLAGFVPMKGAWRADRAAVRNARRQAPLGIKITYRAFGKDRRMPITNKYR